MRFTKFSFRKPVTVFLLFCSAILIGILLYPSIPLEFFPEVEFPYIGIMIPYPGAGPQEVENQITRPVEEIISTLSDIKRIESDSSEGASNIFIEFKWGVDPNLKAIEAKEKIENIRDQLPNDIERFFVNKFSPTDDPLMQLRISSNRDLSDSYDLLNRLFKRRIQRLNGVSKVELYGVEKKEVEIELLMDRINAYKIGLNQLAGILQRSNFMINAGKITGGKIRYQVHPDGELKTPEDVRNILIKENIRLRDLANIKFISPELTFGRHLDGKYAIGLDVYRQSGHNLVDVSKRVKKAIDKIGKNPQMQGINLFIMFDQAEGVLSSLNELLKSGLIGGGLAILILIFFLRKFSSTMIVVLSIPCSIIITLVFMFFLNISLNILSMVGLLLAVGMLVDNSVVVTENIYRHRIIAKNGIKSVLRGVKEVVLPITAGTFTTMIVFLPNIIGSDSELSLQIKHVAIPLCIALAVSLILAQTVIPLLASRVKNIKNGPENRAIKKLSKIHHRWLAYLITHKWKSAILIILIFASIIVPVMLGKIDMFPPQNAKQLFIHYNINDNYVLEQIEKTVDRIENHLFENKKKFEIDSVYSYYTGNYAMTTINLIKKDRRKDLEELKKLIKEELPEIPIGDPAFDNREGSLGKTVSLRLLGPSTGVLFDWAQKVSKELSRVEGFRDVYPDASTGAREVRIRIDRQKAKKQGLNPQEIARNISIGIRGVNLPKIHYKESEIDVKVRFEKKSRKNLDDLMKMLIFKGDGEPVRLSSFADLVTVGGPVSIKRTDRITSTKIKIDRKEDMTSNKARQAIREVLDGFKFPSGYSWDFGSGRDYEQEAIQTMMINTLMALALIYLLMASLFESLLFPAGIWISILFSIIGVFWFFLLSGTTFSIMAWMGVLILIGVVVNNGIVLIDYINLLRGKGYSRYDAILKAAKNRLRPILMTAGTTVLSLIPLCLTKIQIGGGGPPYFPMARALAGGLTFSTLITLIILPVIYVYLDDLRNWTSRIFSSIKK